VRLGELEALRQTHLQQVEAKEGEIARLSAALQGEGEARRELEKSKRRLTQRVETLETGEKRLLDTGPFVGPRILAVLEERKAEVAKLGATLEQREAVVRKQEAALVGLRQRAHNLEREVLGMEELRGRCELAEQHAAERGAEGSKLQGVVQAKEGEIARLTAALQGEGEARRELEASGGRLTQRVETLETGEKRLLATGPSVGLSESIFHAPMSIGKSLIPR